MSSWRRRARLLVALFAVVFAVFVAMAFKDRPAAPAAVSSPRLDPAAVVESSGGTRRRYTLGREDGHVDFDQLFTYADGSTRMSGVTIVSENRGGHSYTVTAKEGEAGKDESVMTLTGEVSIASSDGFTARTDEAVYTEQNNVVRAPGMVAFSRGRLEGTGVGMTYDTSGEILTILEAADIHVAAGEDEGPIDMTAGRATFPRARHLIQFERGVTIRRSGQVVAAETALAHLSDDDQRLLLLELRGDSTVSAEMPAEGALESMSGRDIDLHYGDDGEALERARAVGDAIITLAGAGGGPGRRVSGSTLEVGLGPDGSTPTSLTGRDRVGLMLPAGAGSPQREITADALSATGQAGTGLTGARFTGRVHFTERGEAARMASSSLLDVDLAEGSGAIGEARFARDVRFAEGDIDARAAAARYRVDDGVVELTGSEPANPVPNVVNDQIDVRAVRIDLTFEGPSLHATGDVKSVIKPSTPSGDRRTHVPALLDQDEPVTVTSDELQYDGGPSTALYTGRAWLWQGDTSIKGDTLTLDSSTGDLSANGSVTSTTVLDETDEDGQVSRVPSVATSAAFAYEEASRRATYTTEAHISGQGRDLTADKVEVYLTESGDEVERMEAYESITLIEQQRRTTGSRMTYTAADERYLVTGSPATIVDECGRETRGQRISFQRESDTVTVDGGTERASTRGGSCP